ncbi:uncharacterized protein BXIN_0010 [Babesia sp. Xinjiang]|uniref:uncharacterized protein n=1 Tax=Babesia sp. Xinjiang TaxID=462227 RepID=UPI000A264F74|nr:uncharacterized protein BXIN_0010 [Babesia sp. Xinjiang]ORM39629.1 hypothetical protein BXIN_0010 [Babesia sp. Xinjiang]
MELIDVEIDDRGDALDHSDERRNLQQGPTEDINISENVDPGDYTDAVKHEQNLESYSHQHVQEMDDATGDHQQHEVHTGNQMQSEGNPEQKGSVKRERTNEHEHTEQKHGNNNHGYRKDGYNKQKVRRTDRNDTRGARGRDFHKHQRGHSGHWNAEAARAKRWDTQIITILDSFDTAKEDILTLTGIIADVNDSSKPAIATFERSVEAFPIKTAAYATVIGILRAKKKSTLAEQIMQRVLHNLGSYIIAGNRIAAIHAMRFLIGAHCSGLVSCQVYQIIEMLINLAKRLEQTQHDNQKEYVTATIAADNLVYIVMASIPWFSREEFSKNIELIKTICNEITAYNDRRNAKLATLVTDVDIKPGTGDATEQLRNPYAYIAAYQAYSNDLDYSDRLASGVESMQSLMQNEWSNTTTYRFYQSKGIVEHITQPVSEPRVTEEVATVTNEILQAVLKIDTDKMVSFKPVPFMPLKFNADCLAAQQITVHDKWIFEEHVLHTVFAFMDDAMLCANQLLKIPFNNDYAEHAIVQVLVNMMLAPIYKRHFTMFAVLVMQHMCNVQPKIEEVFLNIYSQLKDKATALDPGVLADLISSGAYWFSVEFCKVRKEPSKSKYQRGQAEAGANGMEVEAQVTEDMTKEKIKQKNERLFSIMFKPDNNEHINFNQRLLDAIARLVYMDRLLIFSPESLRESIKATVQPAPATLQQLLRDKTIEHRIFINLLHFNKLAKEENELRNQRIIGFINNLVGKEPLKEMPSNLFAEDKTPEVVMTDAATDPSGVKTWNRDDLVLIFWESVVILGNKSLTHLLRLIEFHGEVLKNYISHEQSGAFEDTICYKVLLLTRNTLKNDTKKFELVTDELLRQKIVTPADACRFVYRFYPTAEFFSNHAPCILECAFDFVRERLDHSRARLAEGGSNMDVLHKAHDEREAMMRELLKTITELTNNLLMQGVDSGHEAILASMLKNIILNNAREINMIMQLRSEALERGFHRHVVSAIEVTLLTHYVQAPI